MKLSLSALSFTAALACFAMATHAAEETLLGNGNVSHGGFGAIEVKGTQVDGEGRVFTGIKGAWVINHGFYLGGAGYGMNEGVPAGLDSAGERQYMHMGYGGLLLGYTFFSDRMVHFGIESLVGGGGYFFMNNRWDCDDDCGRDCDDDVDNANIFFVWEPTVHAEVNVTRYMRVAVGGGYRMAVRSEEKDGISSQDLSGLTASLALKFGKF